MRHATFSVCFAVALQHSLYETRLAGFFLLWAQRDGFYDVRFRSGGRGLDVIWDPVYRLVKQIPRGRVLTYGGVAKALRLRGGARSAGRAMGATPRGKGIPWHRVLGANGKILIREPYASLQK